MSAEGKTELINKEILEVMENIMQKHQKPKKRGSNTEGNNQEITSEEEMEEGAVGTINSDQVSIE